MKIIAVLTLLIAQMTVSSAFATECGLRVFAGNFEFEKDRIIIPVKDWQECYVKAVEYSSRFSETQTVNSVWNLATLQGDGPLQTRIHWMTTFRWGSVSRQSDPTTPYSGDR